MILHTIKYINRHRFLLLLILVTFIFHMLIIVPSGSSYCFNSQCGIFFWGAHEHDAVWHLALANVSFSQYPFILPNYAGGYLSGYNFLLDFFLLIVSKIGIPPIITYFKILPFIWFILFTYLSIILARKISKLVSDEIKDSPLFVFLLLFFFYFGGSFGYLLTLYHNRSFQGSSSLLAMQAGLTLVNLQYAFSLIIILSLLVLLKSQKLDLKKGLFIGLLLFINLGLKFYGGVISAFMVIAYYFLIWLNQRKKIFLPLSLTALFALGAIFIFYNPLSAYRSGSPLRFSPFATVHPIIEEPALFYLKKVTNARYYLYAHGFGIKLLIIELFSLFLFLFLNLGVRFLGLVYWVIKLLKRKITNFDLVIFSTIIFATFLTVFFTQKGEWWNTTQFFYYAIFLSNIFIAEFIYQMITSKKVIGVVFSISLLLLTIPENYDVLRGLNILKANSYISREEIMALNFLKKQPKGVVYSTLTQPDGKKNITPPYPLYAVHDTSYIAAFSGQPSYLADLMQLRLIGIDYQPRLERINDGDCTILKKVKYIYRLKDYDDAFLENCLDGKENLTVIFQNEMVKIYEK